jgi:transcriptional regulator with XRE-family HTH domain
MIEPSADDQATGAAMRENAPESIGLMLRRMRVKRGRSQSDQAFLLSDLSGQPITRNDISRWENEGRLISSFWRKHFAQSFDVSEDELQRALVFTRSERRLRDAHVCGCGAVLAADNLGSMCTSCSRKNQNRMTQPPMLEPEWFDTPGFRLAFASRDMGKVFRVYRTDPRHWSVYGPDGIGQEALGTWLGLTQARVSRIENGYAVLKNLDDLIRYAQMLHLPETFLWFDLPNSSRLATVSLDGEKHRSSDEEDALELARRVAASDVGDETLSSLEGTVDELAIAYSKASPAALLDRIRQHLAYVNRLLDTRKTLREHRRLLVIGGWLSLLGATVHIDLKQYGAASARLKTAASLARHAGHDEIRAWCFETEAWRVLTEGDYRSALDLSRAAQSVAPTGSSAAIQATAQEGRALARLKQQKETYSAIERVNCLVSPMLKPDQPEHHFRYDPDKSVAYVATTLAWLGDPAAEGYAREIIRRLTPTNDVEKWPRRVASANIDLALALLVTGRLDEACDATLQAISSGRMVPSNYWRAAEVVEAVEAQRLPEATVLREAYQTL